MFLILVFGAFKGEGTVWDQAAASGAILLLAAVLGWWGKKNRFLRCGIPGILFCLVYTIREILRLQLDLEPDLSAMILGFLLLMMAWGFSCSRRGGRRNK